MVVKKLELLFFGEDVGTCKLAIFIKISLPEFFYVTRELLVGVIQTQGYFVSLVSLIAVLG